ncbi:NADP-dependent oxidoreductase domain-containing protein [Lentinula edodes]|uniref:NADP-dependent oxidoreductase domain-containing protein n=1 Tax=Lentinula lateritia TaxID=40482 RepID=A0A9W9DI27_9AGAR|nr:NADP-dependent oxidoreductase domain-containing protein [Lentinula edodes]
MLHHSKVRPYSLPFRRLKPSGLRVPLFSLGGFNELASAERSRKTAFENGVNMFNTAEGYWNGKSEEEIKWCIIKEVSLRHSNFVISTKLHLGMRRGPNNGGLARKHIFEDTQESLCRLQMDYVNVIFAHRPDPTVLMEEIVHAFNYEIEKGWVLYWVTSEWPAWEIEDAFHVADKLNLIGPIAERHRHKHDFKLTPSEGEYTPPYKKYGCTAEGREKIRKVKELGSVVKELETTIAALALTWVAKHPDTSTVILGATRPQQIVDNLKAIEVLPKPPVMEKIEDISL